MIRHAAAIALYATCLSAQETNLAPTGTATQSSFAGFGEQPGYAIDGNRDGYWWNGSTTCTGNQLGAWWQVAWPNPGPLHEVRIVNRADCCGNRLANFRVEVKNGATVVFAQDFHTFGSHVPNGKLLRVLMPGTGVTANTIRITNLGTTPEFTNHLQFAEVEAIRNGPQREVNVALQGAASQSSNSATAPAPRAIDGDTNGLGGAGSVAITGTEAGAWWRVDHQRVRIDKINLWPMTYGQAGCRNFRVAVFDGTTEVWGQDLFTAAGSSLPRTAATVLQPGVTGNAVKITSLATAAGARLEFAEVEVIRFANTAADVRTFGAGCLGTGVTTVPALATTGVPRLGTSLVSTVQTVPGAAVLVTGLSNSASALGALPRSLAAVGAPHCWLLTGLDSSQVALGAAGSATFSLTVPNNPALNGLLLFQQAAVLVPAANALGAVVTNGMRLTVGN
ncbi:MAG: discoidin domain-containing protein [Planctomycetes bacterium]|nr:discoidin domain-containing protein [Planctomycetota bacterium]